MELFQQIVCSLRNDRQTNLCLACFRLVSQDQRQSRYPWTLPCLPSLLRQTLTLPYDEVFPSIMPGVVQVSPLPPSLLTTFSAHTRSQLASLKNGNKEDVTSIASSPNPAYATLNVLAGLPDPFKPTCATSALRALWKWRSDCDRDLFAHLKPRCWTRAPTIQLCCDEADSQSPFPDPVAGLKVGKELSRKARRAVVASTGQTHLQKSSCAARRLEMRRRRRSGARIKTDLTRTLGRMFV